VILAKSAVGQYSLIFASSRSNIFAWGYTKSMSLKYEPASEPAGKDVAWSVQGWVLCPRLSEVSRGAILLHLCDQPFQHLCLRSGGLLLHRNVQRFRGGLGFKAHRQPLQHLCLRVSLERSALGIVFIYWGFGLGRRGIMLISSPPRNRCTFL